MDVNWHSLLKNNNFEMVDIIDLKVDFVWCFEGQTGIYPAHHMNHKYWISVVLNEEIEDEKIMILIDLSFNVTNEKQLKITFIDKITGYLDDKLQFLTI